MNGPPGARCSNACTLSATLLGCRRSWRLSARGRGRKGMCCLRNPHQTTSRSSLSSTSNCSLTGAPQSTTALMFYWAFNAAGLTSEVDFHGLGTQCVLGILLPVSLRVPLPVAVWRCLHVLALVKGLVSDTRRSRLWLDFGLYLLLGFHGLLRPGEITDLRRLHVAIPTDFSIGGAPCIVVRIDAPKTRKSNGRVQHVVIHDVSAVDWIQWHLCDRQPNEALFCFSPAHGRRLFGQLCREAGLDSCKFTPASMRTGGTTFLYVRGTPVDKLRFMGRWKGLGTLEHYIQEAAAIQCSIQLPPAARALVSAVHTLRPAFEAPPRLPRAACLGHGSGPPAQRVVSQGGRVRTGREHVRRPLAR